MSGQLLLELDDYEAANLLHALNTHPCLNSGDWFEQVRRKTEALAPETRPNHLWCQRNGGHGASEPPL